VTVGVDEARRDHTFSRIDDSVNRSVIVFPDVLYLTIVDDYASVPENAMFVTLKGDDNLGVDSEAVRHEAPPFKGHNS
tara:strand:- start:190 stop:423 length:234 start_codon:yes stop_codon:yes gene_type:complete